MTENNMELKEYEIPEELVNELKEETTNLDSKESELVNMLDNFEENINKIIDNKLVKKTEEEIMNMDEKELDELLGEKITFALNNEAKKNKIDDNRKKQAKIDAALLLKKQFEIDLASGELQKQIAEMKSEITADGKEIGKDIDIPQIIFDLCTSTGKMEFAPTDSVQFKSYMRGLKNAGTLEPLHNILKKYKFKTLLNFMDKSFNYSYERVFGLISEDPYTEFRDTRTVPVTLLQEFENEYSDEVIKMVAFLFFMTFDKVKKVPIPYEQSIFAKYFLEQLHHVGEKAEFASKELFINSLKKIMDIIKNEKEKNNTELDIFESAKPANS